MVTSIRSSLPQPWLDAVVDIGARGLEALVRKRRNRHQVAAPQDESVSVVVPASYGSFGDEALALGTAELLSSRGLSMRTVVNGAVKPWEEVGAPQVVSEDSHVGRLGLTMRRGSVENLVQGSSIWVLGADYVDGAYGLRGLASRLSLLNHAAEQGRAASLINFSFRERPRQGAVKLLRRLDSRVQISLRDEVSAQRFRDHTGMQASAFPDLARYLIPSTSLATEGLFAWKTTVGRPVVSVVVNAHLANNFGSSLESLSKGYAQLIDGLVESGYAASIVSHDIRDIPGDNALITRLITNLSSSPKLFRVTIPSNAAEAKGLLSHSDLCVSSRMHPAVATLSLGIPTFGLEYVGKFLGQFRWYGAEKLLAPWQLLVENPQQLLSQILSIDLLSARAEIAAHNERLRKIAPPWIIEG